MEKQLILAALAISFFSKDKDGNEIFTQEQRELLVNEYDEEKVSLWEKNILAKAGDSNTEESNEESETPNNTETNTTASFSTEDTAKALRLIANNYIILKQSHDKNELIMNRLLNQDASSGTDGGHNNSNTEEVHNNENGLMGSHDPLMALDHPWNKRANDVINGGSYIEDIKYSSADIDTIKDQLGAYYRERYKDELISWVRNNQSLEGIFPIESNVRDQQVLVNVFLGQFSQPFQDSWSPKGKFSFQPEILELFDVKLDHVFSKLKSIERSWISYLNNEGSKAIKWSFIHYLLMEVTKKLHKERTIRTVRGVYSEPEEGKAGHFLHAAHGFLKRVKIYIAEKKLKPFNVGAWPEVGVVEWTKDLVKRIPQEIREEGLELIGSKDYKLAYKEDYRRLYGKDTDFKGEKEDIELLESIKIVACPEMAHSKRLVITLPNNFKRFEGRPNEMTDFQMEVEKRQLNVLSDWKEGFQAIMVGKVRTDAEWEAEDVYNHQLIFCNDVDEPEDYFVEMMENVENPSVIEHTSIISSSMQKTPLEITDINDAKLGDIISIKSRYTYDKQGIKIAKSGKFANLKSDWNPQAGDILQVMKISGDKFIEIDRRDRTSLYDLILPDATTFSVDNSTEFKVSENTKATAITDIEDMIPKQIYTIHGSGTANATTIANGGEFMLKETMTLGASSWIKLVYSSAIGKIVEIKRG